VLYFVIYQCKR